jgi:hypothetical protein
VLGLTHPAGDVRWFGCRVSRYFVRWVDGDRYLAVLREPNAEQLVDAIPFEPCNDPRPTMKKAATEWARNRGVTRRAGSLQRGPGT